MPAVTGTVAASRAWAGLALLAQQNPIVVDIAPPPPPAQDISIEVVLGMFALTGVFLAVAAIGALVVGSAVFVYKRRRDAAGNDAGHTHTRLRI